MRIAALTIAWWSLKAVRQRFLALIKALLRSTNHCSQLFCGRWQVMVLLQKPLIRYYCVRYEREHHFDNLPPPWISAVL